MDVGVLWEMLADAFLRAWDVLAVDGVTLLEVLAGVLVHAWEMLAVDVGSEAAGESEFGTAISVAGA